MSNENEIDLDLQIQKDTKAKKRLLTVIGALGVVTVFVIGLFAYVQLTNQGDGTQINVADCNSTTGCPGTEVSDGDCKLTYDTNGFVYQNCEGKTIETYTGDSCPSPATFVGEATDGNNAVSAPDVGQCTQVRIKDTNNFLCKCVQAIADSEDPTDTTSDFDRNSCGIGACSSDDECASGLFCNISSSENYIASESQTCLRLSCVQNPDSCESDFCTEISEEGLACGFECTSDSDCTTGTSCLDVGSDINLCVDSGCEDGNCPEGNGYCGLAEGLQCGDSCVMDSQCPTDHFCSDTRDRCVRIGCEEGNCSESGGLCGDVVTEEPGGGIAQDETTDAITDQGDQTGDGDEQTDGQSQTSTYLACENFQCVERTGSSSNQDGCSAVGQACGATYNCNSTTSTCEMVVGGGGQYTTSAACSSNCVAASCGSACAADSDCPSGHSCSNLVCVLDQCTADPGNCSADLCTYTPPVVADPIIPDTAIGDSNIRYLIYASFLIMLGVFVYQINTGNTFWRKVFRKIYYSTPLSSDEEKYEDKF